MSRSITTANSPVDPLLDGFVGYLREERGVAGATVEAHVADVRRFLARRGQRGIGELSAAEVSKAVLAEVAGWVAGVGAPVSVRAAGTASTVGWTSCRCRSTSRRR
jgi:hypothetical protein